ncbi:MAG: trypsin-like peptidase domain-containing protein [Gammaproteobacteria bacterium]|nr:trypsin-like peptidase domain-containing protein [Gammaproteobacteria bacterium]
MKLIKAVAFLLQFGLIGLAIAVIYLLIASDRGRDEIVDFLAGRSPPAALRSTGPPVHSYADAVASSASSVVTIYTSKTVRDRTHPLLDDPIFSQIFGDQLQLRERSRSETNLGSGVIIGSEGYILTNQHVIDGADEILISLADGRGSEAVVIGEDRDTDIAILQVPISGLAGIRLADGTALRVGDVVLAIGNPLNVGQTVTMGIVSATGRNRLGLNTFENFIQTDAAINPGNSGGALVNARGELIGINTVIFSQSGGSQGIGFAIPVSLALDVMREIIDHGEVTRGWLGVEGTEITASAAMATGDPGIRGALVVGVFVNSPADRAGIRAGDIITAIDGEAIQGIRDLLERVTLYRPGDKIAVMLARQSDRLTLEMQVIQRPQQITRN